MIWRPLLVPTTGLPPLVPLEHRSSILSSFACIVSTTGSDVSECFNALIVISCATRSIVRNLETLRFIEQQRERFAAGELEDELTDEERAMHEWLAADPDAAHALFRSGAMETLLPSDASQINVMVCHSRVGMRTSTNPAIRVSFPGIGSIHGPMFDTLRTWWLSLDKHWGAFIVLGGPPGFSSGSVDGDVIRVINRSYLTQFLEGGARYLIAEDSYIAEDLRWAGFERNGSSERFTRRLD